MAGGPAGGGGRDLRHRRRPLRPAPAAARPRRRGLGGRQAAAHGRAAARGRRLGAVRTSAQDREPRDRMGARLADRLARLDARRRWAERLVSLPVPRPSRGARRRLASSSPSWASRRSSWPSSGWPGSSTNGSRPRRRRGTPTAEVPPAHDHSPIDRGSTPPSLRAAPAAPSATPLGGWWVHLRRCAQCGHVGCCDTSPAQHATAHFQGHRAPGGPELRARRGLVLGLPHRRAGRRPGARRAPPRAPRTSPCPARPTASRPTGGSTSTSRAAGVTSRTPVAARPPGPRRR